MFKVNSERQIYEKLFKANLFTTLRAFVRNLVTVNILLYFALGGDAWPEIWTEAFMSKKSTPYLLDHGDFISPILLEINTQPRETVPTV